MHKKIIQRRPLSVGRQVCNHPLLDRLYRARNITDICYLDHSLNQLIPPHHLDGIDEAVNLLLHAHQHHLSILVVGDFDADGATSTALMVSALRALGFTQVDFLIPNRFEQGYGLSVDVAKMAVERGAELVITVDNGVSSHDGVAYLKERGIRVLITDHHLPTETLPCADAIINPNLVHCTFPSKALAGVGVAFYLMLALRAKLRELGEFNTKTQPNFTQLLDLVALGTIADVVALDQNNRILAHQGLQRIQQGQCRAGIKALVEVSKRQLSRLSTADLAFAIAPRLNAAGRLDNMSSGVELLLCEDMQQARALAYDLDALNQTRREIEAGMKEEALAICQNLTNLGDDLPYAISLYQKDWHQGVLGILASRIKDTYHRPTIAFAYDNDGVLRGSARSIEGVHIRDVLERIHSQYPNMILKFGGHAMAAGLSLKESEFSAFQEVFDHTVKNWVKGEILQDVIWTDGELEPALLNLPTAELLQQASPWGQAFPEPLFDGEFRILQQRLLKNAHLKLLVEPKNGGPLLDAIAFNIDTKYYPDLSLKFIRLVYKLNINEFRDQRAVQLFVEYLEPIN